MLSLILFLAVISAFPSYPCAFYGDVTYNESAIEEGYFLTAKINGVISGVGEIQNGKYGYGSESFIVLSTNPNAKVEFYVSDLKVGEKNFEDKEIIQVDFELTELPIKTESPVNGICEVEEGECTKNAIDCNPEIVDACVGNGRCDLEIGEDCSNAEEDCGACEFCGDGICNNEETCSTCSGDCGACPSTSGGSSGGGGGGSSSSSSKRITTLSTNTSINNTNSSDLNLTIKTYEEDEETFEEDEENKKSKITGGFIKTTGGKIGLSAIIIGGVIILAYLGISLRRRIKNE